MYEPTSDRIRHNKPTMTATAARAVTTYLHKKKRVFLGKFCVVVSVSWRIFS